MKSIKSTLLSMAGFVYFVDGYNKGRWIPRLFAKKLLADLMVYNGPEAQRMRGALSAALYGDKTL